jgi:hypothetical protein
MIQIPMTPEVFAKAKGLLAAPGTDIRSFSESGPQSGSFATAEVAFTYSYDGATLHLVVTAKHGLAKIASEDTIKSRLVELLGKV